jgi:hypothetical protein
MRHGRGHAPAAWQDLPWGRSKLRLAARATLNKLAPEPCLSGVIP